jgi:hypothetical protein
VCRHRAGQSKVSVATLRVSDGPSFARIALYTHNYGPHRNCAEHRRGGYTLAALWSLSIWDNARFLEFASALSALVLIVGAVIEDWPKLKQIGLLTAKVIIFRSNSFERCTLKKLIVHSVGAMMVVAGIAGELVFETRTFIVEDGEATAANVEIGRLKVRAGELEQENLKLQGPIADANERARHLENSTTQLQIDLQKQEQATAEAAKEAALANAKLGGWKLDQAAKIRFAGQVNKFPGTPFDLAVNPVEAPFMEELDALLTSPSVGWVRLPPKPDNTLMAILIDGKASIILSSGIVLEVDQDQLASLKPAVIALGTALHKELDLKKVTFHLVPPGSWGRRIHIIIGRRE